MTISEYLSLSADDRYEEMRCATLAAMPQKYFDKYFKSTKKRWLDLTRTWDKFFNLKKHYVLTSVIHKIFWGVYPYQETDPNFLYLLELVEAELLDDGEAYQSWSKWIVFKRVMGMIIDSMHSCGNSDIDTLFIEHYHYLKSRALCKIMYDKNPPQNYAEYVRGHEEYEKIINLLIPASTNWSREQWGNDLNVADALNRLYGIDYSASYEKQRDYERLIITIRATKDRDSDFDDYLWCVSNISELPLSLARVIWPNNLESIVASTFVAAYEFTLDYEKKGQPFSGRKNDFHPLGHFDRKELKNSWLFKLANQWFQVGLYSGEQLNQIKPAIFDLQMTC